MTVRRAWLLAIGGLWLGAAVAGCVGGDTGVNPPPARLRAAVDAGPPPAADVQGADGGTDASGPDAEPEPTGVAEPDPVTDPVTDPEPVAPEARPEDERDPDRFQRIGTQWAVTTQLLDRLPNATVASPHIKPGRDVVPQGPHHYRNPWAQGPHTELDQRTVWGAGTRWEIGLRAALVLPAPGHVEWPLGVLPPHSALAFDTIVGTRAGPREPVRITVQVNGEELLSIERSSVPMHRLRQWHPVRVDLAQFAGQRVTLRLAVSPVVPGAGWRHTAFFAEPVILTEASHPEAREASRAATGLDVADNILLIIVDAQRADTIGPERVRRGLPAMYPVMERLVADGTTFTQAFSVGNQTRLSTYAMWTGNLPTLARFHQTRWRYSDRKKADFYAGRPALLPRLLRRLGYRTMGVGNNAFFFGNNEISLDIGMDRWIDHRRAPEDTGWITETAVDWLRTHRDERFFLTVNYNNPHFPYAPPKASFDAFRPTLDAVHGFSKPYLGEIKWTDENIGQLLAVVQELGLEGKTAVLITSDHGEVMDRRHNCWNENFESKCHHQHGKTLYDEEIHVPLVFRLPGRIPAGRTVTTTFSHLDLAPTLLGLIGARPDPRQQGRDQSHTLLGRDPEPPVPVLAEARLSRALRWEGFKYIVHDRAERMRFDRKTLFDRNRSLEELYDLEADPDEMNNLALEGAHPRLPVMRRKLTELHAMLQERMADPNRPSPLRPPAAVTLRPASDARPGPEAPAAPAPPAAPPEAPPEAPPSVVNVLLGQGDTGEKLTGTITTPGRFVDFRRLGESASTLVNEREIRVDIPTPGVGLRFATIPEDAPLHIDLRLGEHAVDGQRFFVGPYGLRLLEDPRRLDDVEDLALATASPRGASRARHSEPGVYFWRVGAAAANDDTTIERAGELDKGLQSIMKEWGYAK